jgi:hypothetical protein
VFAVAGGGWDGSAPFVAFFALRVAGRVVVSGTGSKT